MAAYTKKTINRIQEGSSSSPVTWNNIFDQVEENFDDVQTGVNAHVDNQSNPHNVTSTQIPYSNVDSGLNSETVKAAIDELDFKFGQGATNLPTPDTLVKRDLEGRARVEDPSHNLDIANKQYVSQKVTSKVGEHSDQEGGVHGIPEGERALHTGDEIESKITSKVGEHSDQEGGVHGIPEGERALHTGDEIESDATPIGGYVTVQTDLTGAENPDPTRYIKLEAGLTGAGQYNEGKLGSESVTGSAPLVEATAEIVDAESPLKGQTVHLLETERRFFRAGLAGTVEMDQMQRITGQLRAPGIRNNSLSSSGAFANASLGVGNLAHGTNAGSVIDFNSADSPDARVSSTTDGETRAKNIGVSVYMRIK